MSAMEPGHRARMLAGRKALFDAIRENRQARVTDLLRQGHDTSAIAAIIGVTTRTVQRDRRDLKRSNPFSGNNPLTAEERAWAARLLDDGASRREVAVTLGRNEATLRKHFPDRCWTRAQSAELVSALRRAEAAERRLRKIHRPSRKREAAA